MVKILFYVEKEKWMSTEIISRQPYISSTIKVHV